MLNISFVYLYQGTPNTHLANNQYSAKAKAENHHRINFWDAWINLKIYQNLIIIMLLIVIVRF